MSALKILWTMVSFHKLILPIAASVIVFVSILTVSVPLYIKFVIEYILVEKASELLYYGTLFFIGIFTLRFIFGLVQDLVVMILRQKIERTYNMEYIKSIFSLNFKAFHEYDKGDLLSRIRSFLNEIEWFMCDFIFFVFHAIFIFIFLSISMALTCMPLFLLVLAFVPCHLYNFKHFIHPLKTSSEQQEHARSDLISFCLQSLNAWNDIRNYYMQTEFIRRNSKMIDRLSMASLSRKISGLRQRHLQAALIATNHASVIVYGSILVIQGQITIGTVFFFLLLLEFFYSPIYRFGAVNESLQASAIKIQRMTELIFHDQKEAVIPESKKDAEEVEVDKVISLEARNLTVDGLFQGLNFNFKVGKIYFIAGPSGCGKSTLLRVLAKQSNPSQGHLLINDIDTRGWPEFKYREFTQCAMQEAQLFSSTILGNINLDSQDEFDSKQLTAACYYAVADEFIEQLPYSYHTRIEEQGRNFSGGQQQRLCLARLFFHDADVMLLDEPTSALDTATEKVFFERLQELKKDKVIIIVNHRAHNALFADVLLELRSSGLAVVDALKVVA
jgi:subfamily B ATP-binding cassette protein MsbA